MDGEAQEWLDERYPLAKRANIEKLDLSSLGSQGDLKLEGFVNLKRLDCSDNELEGLDIKDCGKLEYLDCSNNSSLKKKPFLVELSKLRLELVF